jgi:hypothetical protein
VISEEIARNIFTRSSQYPYIKRFIATGMNINQFSGLCIMAVIAVLVLTATKIPSIPAVFAQNMTGSGNMTGGNMTAGGANMTDMNQTGSISQVVPDSEQEQESGNVDITSGEGGQVGSGNDQGGNTG